MKTDKELIRQRFESNFRSYNRLAQVQMQICTELATMIADEIGSVPPSRAMEIGAGTGFLTSRLTKLYPSTEWYVNDLAPRAEEFVSEFLSGANHSYMWGDAEQLDFPSELNLIASASTVQWFENLDEFIRRAAESLSKRGVLAISTFGAENFKEITTTMGDSLSYFSRTEIESMMADHGFDVVSSGDYIKSMLFDSPTDVLRHIKATGVNSIRKTRMTRGLLQRFEDDYRSSFSIADGRVTLTYHPILIVGKKR